MNNRPTREHNNIHVQYLYVFINFFCWPNDLLLWPVHLKIHLPNRWDRHLCQMWRYCRSRCQTVSITCSFFDMTFNLVTFQPYIQNMEIGKLLAERNLPLAVVYSSIKRLHAYSFFTLGRILLPNYRCLTLYMWSFVLRRIKWPKKLHAYRNM